MSKFKTINGTLCIMTEPLVPSIEYPYVISGIKTKHPSIVTKDMDALLRIFIIAYSDEFEVIGYPVVDGSKDWALYQMMQGEKIYHHKSPSIMYCKHASKIMREVRCGCVDYMSIDAWLNGADKSGWQIYTEPKEEPQHAKEPMADCENCKHVCTNSNIDHCHMYEPKHESENIIHGHIPADMHLKYFHLYEFKVGDWVEHKKSKEQGRITYISGDNYDTIDVKLYGEDELETYTKSDFNTDFRKLSPSKVIVKIGCLSGTVGKAYGEEKGTFILSGLSGQRNVLWLSMLDTPTREFVESLLKAQEEE